MSVTRDRPAQVLLYRSAIAADRSDAGAFETLFDRNGWSPQWRNDVYAFHHLHSTAHEVLWFAAGCAQLLLGGPDGRKVTVQAADAVLLPTGTGNCNLGSSRDFLVVGAYPPGPDWDTCRKALAPAALDRMQGMPVPAYDPVQGRTGGLMRLWQRA